MFYKAFTEPFKFKIMFVIKKIKVTENQPIMPTVNSA